MPNPTVVYNDDVVGLVDRIVRVTTEVLKCQSADMVAYSEYDIARIESYLTDFEKYLNWVVSAPKMDYPETHPTPHPMPEAPEIADVDNPMVEDILRLLVRMRGEIVSSASARQPSGLVAFDEARQRNMIARARKLITDYIKSVSPIDLPESSPSAPMTGRGITGT